MPIIFFILVLSEKTCKAAYLSDKGVHGSIEADLGVGSSDIERDFSAPAAGQEEITLEKSEGEINRVNCFGIRCEIPIRVSNCKCFPALRYTWHTEYDKSFWRCLMKDEFCLYVAKK